MSCCNKTGGCQKPREEMLDLGSFATLGTQGAAMIGHLLTVARTGIVDMLHFKNNDLQALAMEIQQLWIAAQMAKLVQPVDVEVDTKITDVTINFGPAKQYALKIPVTGAIAKKELASSLRRVADILDPPVVDNQLPLPFEG